MMLASDAFRITQTSVIESYYYRTLLRVTTHETKDNYCSQSVNYISKRRSICPMKVVTGFADLDKTIIMY